MCSVCAPLYQLTTVVGGSKGQERPRLSSRCPTSLPASATPQPGHSDSDEVGTAGGEQADEAEVSATPAPVPPPLPAADAGQTTADTAGQDCALYLSGECPFGISGRCLPYIRWGNISERGCSGTTCGKSHATLCPKSQDLRCLDRICQ